MQQRKIFFAGLSSLVLLSGISFTGCHEVGPAIDLTESEYITYIEEPESPQDKVVLMEDFTGAACPNCPTAHEALAATIDAHPGRIAAVAEYNYFLDPLYIEQNMLSDAAADVYTYLEGPLAWPQGYIDRTEYSGNLNQPPGNYLSAAEVELAKTPACNIYITSLYDDATRVVNIGVTIKYTEDITNANHLSVMLVENGIIAAQLNGATEDPNYVHNHVLRTMATFPTGTSLPEENTAGRVYEFSFSDTLENNWNSANMQIIAFVHNFETDNKEVLQAAISPLD